MIYSHKSSDLSNSTITSRAIFFFLALALTRCGGLNIGLGGGTSSGDARPSGTPVAQAQFGTNANSISGTVLVFYSGDSATLRLEGLSVPSEANLQVWLYFTPGSSPQQLTLKSFLPNQNYTLSVGTGVTFKSTTIYSTANQTTYATALFP